VTKTGNLSWEPFDPSWSLDAPGTLYGVPRIDLASPGTIEAPFLGALKLPGQVKPVLGRRQRAQLAHDLPNSSKGTRAKPRGGLFGL
jgi:hypothetical protein